MLWVKLRERGPTKRRKVSPPPQTWGDKGRKWNYKSPEISEAREDGCSQRSCRHNVPHMAKLGEEWEGIAYPASLPFHSLIACQYLSLAKANWKPEVRRAWLMWSVEVSLLVSTASKRRVKNGSRGRVHWWVSLTVTNKMGVETNCQWKGRGVCPNPWGSLLRFTELHISEMGIEMTLEVNHVWVFTYTLTLALNFRILFPLHPTNVAHCWMVGKVCQKRICTRLM